MTSPGRHSWSDGVRSQPSPSGPKAAMWPLLAPWPQHVRLTRLLNVLQEEGGSRALGIWPDAEMSSQHSACTPQTVIGTNYPAFSSLHPQGTPALKRKTIQKSRLRKI